MIREFDAPGLFAALDAKRQAAAEIRCKPGQLTGLNHARFATGMGRAMRIRPAGPSPPRRPGSRR